MDKLINGNESCTLTCKDLSILIISYDGAEELWRPFSQMWQKYWPDCPFEKILITQNITFVSDSCFDRIIPISSKSSEAIYRIKETLKQIDSKYVLVMCDDYILYERPDRNALVNIINMMREKEIFCVHLDNKKEYVEKLELAEIRNDNFLVSGGVPSIYEKEFVCMLCEKFVNCTMREWELSASRWLQKEKYNIKSVVNSSFKCYHCVLEGYWRWKPYRWIKRNNIEVVYKTYKKPRLLHSIRATGKAFCFNIVLHFLPRIYKKWSLQKYR